MYRFDMFDKLIPHCYDTLLFFLFTWTVSKSEAIYDSLGQSFKAEMVLIELRPKDWLTNVVAKPRKGKKRKKVEEDEVQDVVEQDVVEQDDVAEKPSDDAVVKGDEAEPQRKTPKKRAGEDANEIPKATRKSLQEFFARRKSF